MNKWKSAFALTVAGVMLAGSALAQSGAGSGSGSPAGSGGGNTATPQMGTQQPQPSASGSSSGTTGTSGSASGSATTGTKSGEMKSTSDMKAKTSGKMARSGGAEQVKAVQQALKDKGMDPGEVDGKMGPKTQSALREYQKKEGLKESGRLDTETMAKLGVAKTSDSGSTTPSASPSTGSSSGAGAATGSGSSTTPSKQTR
jgi:peptidoglycan hydrolase-like protein with peptidoglycan-binding domain